MTIFCKICGQKLDADSQQNVLVLMTKHLGSHQEQSVTLAKMLVQVSQLLATYLLIKRYVRIPAEEKALLQSFQENEVCLMQIFEAPETKEVNN